MVLLALGGGLFAKNWCYAAKKNQIYTSCVWIFIIQYTIIVLIECPPTSIFIHIFVISIMQNIH